MIFQAIRLMYHLGFSAFILNYPFMLFMKFPFDLAAEALLLV